MGKQSRGFGLVLSQKALKHTDTENREQVTRVISMFWGGGGGDEGLRGTLPDPFKKKLTHIPGMISTYELQRGFVQMGPPASSSPHTQTV